MLQLHEQLAIRVKYASMLDSCEMILLIGQHVLSEAGNEFLCRTGSRGHKVGKVSV